MYRFERDILGMNEVRWTGNGDFVSDNFVMMYSGGDKQKRGVGFLMTKDIRKSIVGCGTISDRAIMIKIKCKPTDINMIQVYAPTSDSSEEDHEEFYETLDLVIKLCKNPEIKIVMGDLNAKVGRSKRDTAVEPFGLDVSNKRGNKWNDRCVEHDMSVMNTWFKQHERHLYASVYYLTINRRYRNSVLMCKTKSSADCNSDHNLLFAKLRYKLKRLHPSKRTPRLDLRTLRSTPALQKHYSIEVQNRFDELANDYSQGYNIDESDPEVKWKILENALVENAERVIPKNEQL